MFATCCVCDPSAKNSSLEGPVEPGRPEQQVNPKAMVPAVRAADHYTGNETDAGLIAKVEGHSARSAVSSSLSPEDKVKEKMRLQELVKQFARDAVRGVKCTLLDRGTGEKFEAEYCLDKSLSEMGFESKVRDFSVTLA